MAVAGGGTLLVVDDEPVVRSLACRVLEHEGYRTLAAGDTDTALALVAADPSIALVITDVQMPRSDTAAFVAALARLRPGLPVLYISGYPSDHEATIGSIGPAAAFLQKPFVPAELLAAVRSLLPAHGDRGGEDGAPSVA